MKKETPTDPMRAQFEREMREAPGSQRMLGMVLLLGLVALLGLVSWALA